MTGIPVVLGRQVAEAPAQILTDARPYGVESGRPAPEEFHDHAEQRCSTPRRRAAGEFFAR
ncbi:hypothetical protein [Streptomyces sp. BE230]|uniref:hypothetical protein n=1 Tax=Streptomyces sp. BE230 TaxID=3002526 RepID=UPI002ED248E8|nr:hypothetical protein [Streptomyces sp. BE230]